MFLDPNTLRTIKRIVHEHVTSHGILPEMAGDASKVISGMIRDAYARGFEAEEVVRIFKAAIAYVEDPRIEAIAQLQSEPMSIAEGEILQ